jgi:hypothetical protein
MFETLSKEKINIEMISTSENSSFGSFWNSGQNCSLYSIRWFQAHWIADSSPSSFRNRWTHPTTAPESISTRFFL